MKKLLGLFLAVLFISSCDTGLPKIKLVVLLVVDQMRPDLLTRFDDLYTGGFRWLIDNGVSFTNTHHEHSYTATGPGFYVIGTGQYPGPGGALGNSFYDRVLAKIVNCVEDPNAQPIGGDGKARSYIRYATTGIGDWMKSADPLSKVFSIGGKDRSAVFLGGKHPDLVVYYNYHDRFITSDYYIDAVPSWLDNFNQNLNLSSYRDSLWTKSLPESLYLKYAREDYFEGEEDTYRKEPYSPVFPIGFDPEVEPGDEIMGRPWFERFILNLGESILREEFLGQDDHADLLCISFSAMDWMIHDYGPFSQEIMDACIKLDKYLGDFISNLDRSIGLEHIEFVLTADHGGLPLPEYERAQGRKSGRVNREELIEAYEWIEDEIAEVYAKNLFVRDGANYFFNMEKLRKRNIPLSKPASIIKKYLPKVDGIEKVFTKQEILDADPSDKIMFRLQNMIHIENSPEIMTVVSPGYIYRNPHGTGHGSPYDYDTNVPLLFSRKGRQPRIVSKHVEVADIAPTIGHLLSISYPETVHGTAIEIE